MPIMSTRGAASARFSNHLVATNQEHTYLRARLSQTFTTPGRYTWVVPEGVTSITVLAVGGGGAGGYLPGYASITSANGGGGGGYAYMYDYSVTPGDTYTIQVGCGGGTVERAGTPYWDVQDDGVRYDRSGYTTVGRGGIASWFGSRSICRGGGGMSGNSSATTVGTVVFTGNACGGYYTLGAGLSGGGMHGGMGGNVWTTTTGISTLGGGGGAGSATSDTDLTGMGSFNGMSRGAGTSGGGAGGGGGLWNGDQAANGVAVRVTSNSWLTFQNSYAIWPSLQPSSGPNAANTVALIVRKYTATYTGTYYIKATADNKADVYIDNVLVASPSENFNQVPSSITITLTAGVHVIRIRAYNSESDAGVAVAIYNSSNILVWDTYSTRNAYLPGYYGITPGGQGGGIGLAGITATSAGSGIVGTDATNGIDTSGENFLSVGGTKYDGVSNLYAKTSGYWAIFQYNYAVWPTPYDEVDSFVIYREFTAASTGTYYVRVTADNHANIFINNSFVASADDNFLSVPTPVTVTLNAGVNVIRMNVKNDDNVAGVAMTITDSTGTLVWDTRSTKDSIPSGSYKITSGGTSGSGGVPGKGALTGFTASSTINYGSFGGGGGGGKSAEVGGSLTGPAGANGAVRIMWEPGSAYPSTNTTDFY